jgi:hypothetical protein
VKQCLRCERTIEGKKAHAVYCSASCRILACRARHRARTIQNTDSPTDSLQSVNPGTESVN